MHSFSTRILCRFLIALTLLLLPTGARGAAADEPAWRVAPDGDTTTLERDGLPRVYQVNHPAVNGYPAVSVFTQWDVFGRVVQTQDGLGTSTAAYDDLNRPTQVTPAAGQGATFQYLKDPVLKRLISRMTVTGTAPGSGAAIAKAAPLRS